MRRFDSDPRLQLMKCLKPAWTAGFIFVIEDIWGIGRTVKEEKLSWSLRTSNVLGGGLLNAFVHFSQAVRVFAKGLL